jgi:hypothetical protein
VILDHPYIADSTRKSPRSEEARPTAQIIRLGGALRRAVERRNIRRGHYELATDAPGRHRLRAAFDQLTAAI